MSPCLKRRQCDFFVDLWYLLKTKINNNDLQGTYGLYSITLIEIMYGFELFYSGFSLLIMQSTLTNIGLVYIEHVKTIGPWNYVKTYNGQQWKFSKGCCHLSSRYIYMNKYRHVFML